MKKLDAIFLVSIALTAIVSIGSVHVRSVEPQETTCEPTTAPTIEETIEATQVPTETEVPVTEATEPSETTVETTEPKVIGYDVPLSEDLQLYIIEQAETQGIDPAIIFGMIQKESRFNASAVGDSGNSLGLMQIQPRWNSGWMKQLNCPDLLDPFQNVKVGIHILADHFQRYGDIEMALMAYNAGATGANRHWFSKGVYTNSYSQAVLKFAEELKVEV